MIIVVDTNIIISALIKESIIRKLILNKNFEFITPSYTLSEIEKYKNEICKKANMTYKEFYLLLDKLFNYIKIMNINFYSNYLKEAKKSISDIKDVPFLACALAFNAVIWSDDQHFKQQKRVKALTTKEMHDLVNVEE